MTGSKHSLTTLHRHFSLQASVVVRIVGHKAQQKSGSSAHIPEKLQLGAPISTEFPGGHSARVASRNTLKDLQVVVTATVKTTGTYLSVEMGRNDSWNYTK